MVMTRRRSSILQSALEPFPDEEEIYQPQDQHRTVPITNGTLNLHKKVRRSILLIILLMAIAFCSNELV